MKLTADPIPDGSHEIRIWFNEADSKADSGADIDTVCVLHHLNENECEIALAKGKLNDAANILIGLKALELGYSVLHFHRSQGGRATHWATLTKTVNGMDYYRVDLIKAAAEL